MSNIRFFSTQELQIQKYAKGVLGLPRELRDHIYANLWDKDTLDNFDYLDLVIYHYWHGSKPSIPTFVNPEYVGMQFAREAVEYLYDNPNLATARTNGICWDLFGMFFNTDGFGLEVAPRDRQQHMRKLTVRVGLGPHFADRHMRRYGIQHFGLDCAATLLTVCKSMAKNFELTIRFGVQAEQLGSSSRKLRSIGRLLKPLLMKCKEMGVTTKALLSIDSFHKRLDYSWKVNGVWHSGQAGEKDYIIVHMDVTDLMDKTVSEWSKTVGFGFPWMVD